MYKITLSNYVIAIRKLTIEKVREYEKAGFRLEKIDWEVKKYFKKIKKVLTKERIHSIINI